MVNELKLAKYLSTIVKHFDSLIYQLSERAKAILENDGLSEEEKGALISKRNNFIEIINRAKVFNVRNLAKRGLKSIAEDSEESLNKTLFSVFCFLLSKDDLAFLRFKENSKTAFGYLFVTDGYVSCEKISHYKELLKIRYNLGNKILNRNSTIFIKSQLVLCKHNFIIETNENKLFRVDQVKCINLSVESLDSNLLFLFKYAKKIELKYCRVEDADVEYSISKKINVLDYFLSNKICDLKQCSVVLEVIERTLEPSSFIGANFLTHLSLFGSKLDNINKNTFSSLENLVALSLSNNKIAFIELNSFTSLSSLQMLDLSSNSMEVITVDLFYGLNSLTELNLCHLINYKINKFRLTNI